MRGTVQDMGSGGESDEGQESLQKEVQLNRAAVKVGERGYWASLRNAAFRGTQPGPCGAQNLPLVYHRAVGLGRRSTGRRRSHGSGHATAPHFQRCTLCPWSSFGAEVGHVGSGNAPFRSPMA